MGKKLVFPKKKIKAQKGNAAMKTSDKSTYVYCITQSQQRVAKVIHKKDCLFPRSEYFRNIVVILDDKFLSRDFSDCDTLTMPS